MGELTTRGPETEKLLEIDSAELRALYLERDGIRIALLAFGDATGPLLRSKAWAGPRSQRPASRSGTIPGWLFAFYPDSTRIELIQAPGDPAALPAIPTKQVFPGIIS